MRYFNFDMLNKYYNQLIEQLSDTFLLAIIVIVVYTIVKKFLEWDN
jgi:hypothetical protein